VASERRNGVYPATISDVRSERPGMRGVGRMPGEELFGGDEGDGSSCDGSGVGDMGLEGKGKGVDRR